MQNPFLIGETVYLRPLEPDDASLEYAGWLNDGETNRFLETGHFPSTRASVAEFIAAHSGRSDVVFLAIVLQDGDRHVGNVKLGPIDWVHRRAELGILIGDRDARGRGIGTEATTLVLEHAFGRLNLHRVALGVVADNLPAVRSYEKAGFSVEGTFRQAIQRHGRFVDLLRMAILADEFRARQAEAAGGEAGGR